MNKLEKQNKIAKKELLATKLGSLMEDFWIQQLITMRKEYQELPLGTKKKPIRIGVIKLKEVKKK